jgi:hypothetical protein
VGAKYVELAGEDHVIWGSDADRLVVVCHQSLPKKLERNDVVLNRRDFQGLQIRPKSAICIAATVIVWL